MRKRIFRSIAKTLGKKRSFKLVDFFMHYNDLSIIDYFQYKLDKKELDATAVLGQVYRLLGINEMHGGEEWFIKNCLSKLIQKEKPVFFDVGANVGDYTAVLHTAFPTATIYSFEPNPNTYEKLKINAGTFTNAINIGLSDQHSETTLFMQTNESTSELASIYKEVITDLHTKSDVMEVPIKLGTLEAFCTAKNIGRINFLKIDTEGNELKVIKGAMDLINQNKIDVIQMEFNEMNIISRVFLKDFYELLAEKFDFFRLTRNTILPLGQYHSINEVFRYQDLILINKNIKHEFY